jgi:hypothetical protein
MVLVIYAPAVASSELSVLTVFLVVAFRRGSPRSPAPKNERGREMQRCMNEAQLLIRLGKNAKTAWFRHFTWQAIAPRYVGL